MKLLSYYISLLFIYLIALIPYPIFYGISDISFVLLYYVFGYRRKVVLNNLRNSFPDKNEKELNIISRKYYRYLCDLFLETLKTLVFTKKSASKHARLNPQAKILFDQYYEKKQSIIIVMGHWGNWEWAGNGFSLECKQQLYVIYHPLANSYFNKLMIKMRTRFGTKLIPMKNTYRDMMTHKNEITATAFIADQTPSPDSAFWTKFLNQDTPVFIGTEKIARKTGYPVVYVSVKKVRRGYYEMFAETLFEKPQETKEGEISEAHNRRLERDIIERPEIWLWSHRRWKHKLVKE